MKNQHEQQILGEKFLEIGTIDELPLANVNEIIGRNGFICIRGLINEDIVESAIRKIKENFSRKNDNPTTGESPDDVKTNFQKLSVGSVHSAHHSHNYSRLLRTFYNPLWEEDIYGMHSVFSEMIRLRNRLLKKPDDFACNKIEEGLWTAARIHQYPAGGGFMSQHIDKTLSNYMDEINHDYYQLLLIMSKKGIDFQEGGGFIQRDGEKIIFENQCNPGDVIIYDGQIHHGVEDIDPHKVLDLENISGRLAAFVSLYKDLKTD